MKIAVDGKVIRILAPAKVNLFLEVGAKRSDGFHAIETVMCPVSLCDEILIERTDSRRIDLAVELPDQATIVEEGDNAWQVPNSADNLVFKAAAAVRETLKEKAGCSIRLKKRIPSAAGLGGGSSDAASVVVGCLLAWCHWDRSLATQLCGQIGSDIPFFLGAEEGIGLMLATGRGEICEYIDARPQIDFALVHPPLGCSTAEVYKGSQPSQPYRNAEKIIAACQTGQLQKIGAELFNALQFPASTLNPWISRQLDILSESGFAFSLMSGSGSSCYGLADGGQAGNLLRERAKQMGIPRVYSASAWYAESIENQILALQLS